LDAVASAALPAALRLRAIIDRLALTLPVFLPTAAFGHFRRPGLAWEGSAVEALLGPNLPARPLQSAHKI
jgi:S-adenosylmethionine synthetase